MRQQNLIKLFCCVIIAGVLFAGKAKATSADFLSLDQIQSSASSINSVTSLLIQKNGQLLTERYYNGMDKGEATGFGG